MVLKAKLPKDPRRPYLKFHIYDHPKTLLIIIIIINLINMIIVIIIIITCQFRLETADDTSLAPHREEETASLAA